MLYVINYANGEPFETFRKINTKTAYRFGRAGKVIEYDKSHIPTDYANAHKDIFAYKRGAGLWLWKPWIINDALCKIDDGDWLLYLDSGTTVIRDLHILTDFAQKQEQDLFLMDQPLLCRQFTKKECYTQMGIEDNGENQVLALLILIRKTKRNIELMREWLTCCEKESLISPKKFCHDVEEYEDFYEHREDQSLLSLLSIKHNLPVYRDCSDYGEMPFMYYGGDKYTYNPMKRPECTYPTIILCNRKVHPYIYWAKYLAKSILHKLNIYYTEKRYTR